MFLEINAFLICVFLKNTKFPKLSFTNIEEIQIEITQITYPEMFGLIWISHIIINLKESRNNGNSRKSRELILHRYIQHIVS